MTFITVRLKVSCLLRFIPATNSVAHISQFGDGGLILCWSRIRKFVTYIQRIYRQTEKAIKEATLILWIAGLSGPTVRRIFRVIQLQTDRVIVIHSVCHISKIHKFYHVPLYKNARLQELRCIRVLEYQTKKTPQLFGT